MPALAPNRGACFASDQITVDGSPVGWMYRDDDPDARFSGWNFFSGFEPEGYTKDAENFQIWDVNSIANYDPAIVPYLDAPVGSEWERIPGSENFRRVL